MSVYRVKEEMLVALLIPADGGEPTKVKCNNLNDLLPGDQFMVASRRRLPDSMANPWDQPEGLQPLMRPATWDKRHRNDPVQWQYEVAMGSAGQPRQTRRQLVRGYTPPHQQTPEWLALPPHARYPDIRGDVFVSCYVTNRLTGESIQLSVTKDDEPALMDAVERAYIGYYSAFVHDFGTRIEALPTEFSGIDVVKLRQAVFDEQTRLIELGHLVEFRPDVWHRTFHVPPTPASANVAIEAITDLLSEMSDAADAARTKAADELMAEEARALAPSGRPSRSSLKKKRMRIARAAKAVQIVASSPVVQPAAPAVEAATVEAPTPVALNEPVGPVEERPRWHDPEACTICNDGPLNTVFMPCAHVCCCVDCAKLLKSCPYCLCHIDSVIRLYVV